MKKTFAIKSITIVFALLTFLNSCKKDDRIEDNGFTRQINELVPQTIIDEMESLGMPLNGGGDPPSIENAYIAAPFILKNSNRESDEIGYQFADLQIRFSSQDNDNLTIVLDYVNGPESGTGLAGFIVGDNNEFTVFTEIIASAYDSSAQIVMVLSGRVEDNGIQDLHYANFMLDNYGNAGGYWINNGDGRIIYDSDGFSEIIDYFKSASLSNDNIQKRSGISLK